MNQHAVISVIVLSIMAFVAEMIATATDDMPRLARFIGRCEHLIAIFCLVAVAIIILLPSGMLNQ